jgi:hypothetical protein
MKNAPQQWLEAFSQVLQDGHGDLGWTELCLILALTRPACQYLAGFLAGFLAGLSADFLDNREMVVRRHHIAGRRAGRER